MPITWLRPQGDPIARKQERIGALNLVSQGYARFWSRAVAAGRGHDLKSMCFFASAGFDHK